MLPLVLFAGYLDALSLKNEVADPRTVVENELKEWAKVQLPDGGFPYWPSGTDTNRYVSLRIAHILAIAKEKGIAVPAALNTAKLLDYLERNYRETMRWTNSHYEYGYQGYYAAWTLYVMALHGRAVDPGRLSALVSRNDAGVSALAYAGLAYLRLGKTAEAAAAAQKLRGLLHPTARGVDIANPGNSSGYFNSYSNQLVEQLALALEFFVQQYPGDDMNSRLLYSLLQNKKAGGGYWGNTAITVRVLSAVDALIKAENLERLDVNASARLAATELLRGSFRGLGAKPVTAAAAFDQPPLAALPKDRIEPLVFTRNGAGAVYYTVELRYAIPQELQTYRDEGLGVFMTVSDAETGEEVQGTTLQSGKTYRARVKLSSTHNRTFAALRVPVPSGAEILDAAFVTTGPTLRDEGPASRTNNTPWYRRSSVSHQAIYDNEIQYFYDNLRAGEAEVTFLFRAVRRGVYPTPPLTAECMYEPEIFGRTAGVLWVIE